MNSKITFKVTPKGVAGPIGPAGSGIVYKGDVADYAELMTITGMVQNDAYLVLSDGRLYTYNGTAWPDEGNGINFKGPAGKSIVDIVKTGSVGLIDTHTITYSDSTTSTFDVTNGQDGDDGVGVPTGGTTGQILVKKSNSDYDTEWQNNSGGGLTPEQEEKIDSIDLEGDGTKYLADDGTYKSVSGADVDDLNEILESFLDKGTGGGITKAIDYSNRASFSIHGVMQTAGSLLLKADNSVASTTGADSCILRNIPVVQGSSSIKKIKFNSPRVGGGSANAHVIGISSTATITVLLAGVTTVTGNIYTAEYDVSGYSAVSVMLPFSSSATNNGERYISFELEEQTGLFGTDVVKNYIDSSIINANKYDVSPIGVSNSINNDYTIHKGTIANNGTISDLTSATLSFVKVTPNPNYLYETNFGELKGGNYNVVAYDKKGDLIGSIEISEKFNINAVNEDLSFFYINLSTEQSATFYFRRIGLINKEGLSERDSNSVYFTPFEVQHEVVVSDFDDGILSDDEIIDLAIEFSKGFPNRKLIFNTKQWNIGKSIELPSNTIMEIDGVKIKQIDETFDTLIRGNNYILDLLNPYGFPLEIKPLENVWIIGKNGASLEGPTVNVQMTHPILGLQDAVGDYWGWRTLTVCFSNTRNVKIEGLSISRPRCYAISFDLCKYGEVSNMVINSSLKNGDGVDLRMGCHNFLIDTLSGSTSDDCVALNTGTTTPITFPSDNLVYPLTPCRNTAHLRTCYENSITNIAIKNITMGGAHNCIRLLAIGGLRITNILITDIQETTSTHGNLITIGTGYGAGYKANDISNVRINRAVSNYANYTLTSNSKCDNIWANAIEQNKVGGSLTNLSNSDGFTITNS